jgi:IS1 family transposase
MASEKKREVSLLEHVEAVVKLLNGFTPKDISSQYVLRRLNCLYNRLSDFLVREVCDNYELTDSNSWQQTGKILAAIKHKEFESTRPSVGFLGDVQYECALCRSHITIYNSDHKLSMDLHYQGDVHQQALKQQKMKETQTALPKNVKSTEKNWDHSFTVQEKVDALNVTNKKDVWKFIDQVADKKFHCWLCSVNLSSEASTQQHVTGRCHQKMMAALEKKNNEAECECVTTSKGTIYCQVCNVFVGNRNKNEIEHKWGRAHLQKLLARQHIPSEEKFWSKVPEGLRGQRKSFIDFGIALQCNVCMVDVPKCIINVLSHIRGKRHSRALSGSV